jgi:hypothetical protein
MDRFASLVMTGLELEPKQNGGLLPAVCFSLDGCPGHPGEDALRALARA